MPEKKHRNPARITLFTNRSNWSSTAEKLLKLKKKKRGKADFKSGVMLKLPDGREILCFLLDDTADSLETANKKPLGTIVIDNRSDSKMKGIGNSLAGRILPELLTGRESGRLLQRNSVLLVLPDGPHTAFQAYAAGSFQLGGIIVEPSGIEEILESAYRISRPDSPGKVALCLAGGGIEGMFWEIGVLRALDAYMGDSSVIDFDIFSGISAGSVLGAFMANGVKPYEIANALYGRPSRIDPITRAMLFDPNIGELTKRVITSIGDMARGRWLTRPIDSAMKVTPTAIFSGDKLKAYLKRELSKPEMCDNFNELNKELFIGVTDQDEGRHISFGDKKWSSIPISTAVRASTAMTPYYNPEKIGDRYFVDGIFTRTIDIDIAVAHGASLIICVDPLRPVQTTKAGYVSGKGGVFNTVQSVKSMIKTRFAEMVTKAEETHPNVSVYVFAPTAGDMEQMSGTMMRFFYKTDTEGMAYDSATEQIEKDYEWFAEDLDKHGLQLKKP